MKNIELLQNCKLCPRNCGVDRRIEKGYCRSGIPIGINSWNRHFGEEPVFSGWKGSGTIFLINCNLCCVFCQNFDISQLGNGSEISPEELAEIMMKLQLEGVHNINLVTPTHFSVQIKTAIEFARDKGLKLPVIWNSNAYEKTETLEMFRGLVDIYLPDLKYADNESAEVYSDAENYPSISRRAILEMQDQVGKLVLDEKGIATRGLLIRLLVMPGLVKEVLQNLIWIRQNLGRDTYINLMSQYHPTFQASDYPAINRRITSEEYSTVKAQALELGFSNVIFQG